jgi:short-subunit dehydrogenase
MTARFVEQYGKVAVVAGASEGLGAAFARGLAERGLDLVLIARRVSLLQALASDLERTHRVKVRAVVADLGEPSFADALGNATHDLEVGLAVYNAGLSWTGPLLDAPLANALRVVAVNIEGPLRFIHQLLPAMRARRRGGVVLMSSIAGFQGAPLLATYAASKAFTIVLGESLWGELRADGIDVVTSCAGAIRTPGYHAAATKEAPGILDAREVAEQSLDALGDGPIVVPGGVNKLALFLLRRLMTRRGAVHMVGANIAKTVGERGRQS